MIGKEIISINKKNYLKKSKTLCIFSSKISIFSGNFLHTFKLLSIALPDARLDALYWCESHKITAMQFKFTLHSHRISH